MYGVFLSKLKFLGLKYKYNSAYIIYKINKWPPEFTAKSNTLSRPKDRLDNSRIAYIEVQRMLSQTLI